MSTKLTIFDNGSVKVEGEFDIQDQSGKSYSLEGKKSVFLCRCGLSAKKPFCDGSHKGHFEHKAEAF
ncbi:MAG: CDGSH iron-sulfur domain-containing protein [Cyclobacteriaceae bacterium]